MPLLFLQEWFNSDTASALAWTLLHSLWQGLLAAFIAAIIIIATRRSSAKLRYNLLGFVLLLFVIAALITFYTMINTDKVDTSSTGNEPVSAAGFTDTITASETTAGQPLTLKDSFIAWFNSNTHLLVLAWCLFFLVNCFKLFTGLAAGYRLRTYRKKEVGEDWIKRMERLAKQMGVQRTVRLIESGLVKVPVTFGLLKPFILLPIGLLAQLPPEQAETILLHELAHIRRKDYFVNLLQRFVESVFFFNPGLLWISSLLRQEREACCDDLVMLHTDNRRNYLDALVAFQEYAIRPSQFAMGIVGKRHYLLERVKRIITKENRRLGWMEGVLLIAGLFVITAFNFIGDKEEPVNGLQYSKLAEVPTQGTNEASIATPSQVEKRTDTPLVKIKPVKHSRDKITNRPNKNSIAEVSPVEQYVLLHYDRDVNAETKVVYETIRVRGPNGTRYIIRKVNSVCVLFMINDFVVDKKEVAEYLPLIQKLETIIQLNIQAGEDIKKDTRERQKEVMLEMKQELKEKQAEVNKNKSEIRANIAKNSIDRRAELFQRNEKRRVLHARDRRNDSTSIKPSGSAGSKTSELKNKPATTGQLFRAKLNNDKDEPKQVSKTYEPVFNKVNTVDFDVSANFKIENKFELSVDRGWEKEVDVDLKWELKSGKFVQPKTPPKQPEESPAQPPKKTQPASPKNIH